jgi:hypothetical protein
LREPEIYPDLNDITDAFAVLSFSRSNGFNLGFIPLTEIAAYCKMFEVEDLERFIRLIRAMDVTYIESVEERNKK